MPYEAWTGFKANTSRVWQRRQSSSVGFIRACGLWHSKQFSRAIGTRSGKDVFEDFR